MPPLSSVFELVVPFFTEDEKEITLELIVYDKLSANYKES